MTIDLLPNLNKITVDMKVDKFATILKDMLENNIEQLIYELEVCKQGISQINSLIPNLNSKLNTNDKVAAFHKLNNLLNSNINIDIGNCQSFVDDLGVNFFKIFGIDIQRVFKIPNIDFKKYPIILSDMMKMTTNNIISEILNPIEKEISDLILSVESNISRQLLSLLSIIIEPSMKYCKFDQESILYELNIEKIMNQYGMLINGDIDFTQLEFDFIQSEHFKNINLIRKETNILINRKTNKVF